MATSSTRALIDPLILLYEDLSESRKLSRALREARQSAAASGAEVRSSSYGEAVDTLRALVQTSGSLAACDSQGAIDDHQRLTQISGCVGLAARRRLPNESETIAGVFDGAIQAIDEALARLSEERQGLIHPGEQLRDDDPQRRA